MIPQRTDKILSQISQEYGGEGHKPGIVVHTLITAPRQLRWESLEFKTTLGDIARL